MAQKYLIKVNPQVEKSDAKKMENDLNKRFGVVAKRFGQNMRNSTKKGIEDGTKAGTSNMASAGFGGAIGSGVGSIIGKLFENPYDGASDNLDTTLDKIDKIVKTASDLGISAERYFAANLVAQSTGIDDLQPYLMAFNDRLLQSHEDEASTGQPQLLSNYNQADVLSAFLAFAETMRTMDAQERVKYTNAVFGQGGAAGLAELLTADISSQLDKILQGRSLATIGKQLSNVENKEDLQSLYRARLALEGLSSASVNITNGGIRAQYQQMSAQQRQDFAMIGNLENLAALRVTTQKLQADFNELKAALITKVIPAVQSAYTFVSGVFSSVKEGIDTISNFVKNFKMPDLNPFR